MREFFDMTIASPMHQLYEHLLSFFPRLLGASILIFLGLFLGWLGSKLIRKSMIVLHCDRFFEQCGLTSLLAKARISRPTSDLVSRGVYWLVFLNFFMLGIRTLDEPVMSGVFSRFFAYLPNLLVAVVILFLGLIFSKFVGRTVLVGALKAGLPSAEFLSGALELLTVIFTLSLALEKLDVGKATIVAAFSIIFGGLVLALAIAFGLGGRHLARHYLERSLFRKETKPEEKQ
jgi:hypothetical protein